MSYENNGVFLDLIHEGRVAESTLEAFEDAGYMPPAKDVAKLRLRVRRGKQALTELVEANEPLVRTVFKRHFRASGHLRDDMYQAGRAALARAAEDYDLSSDMAFSSFAYKRIFHAMRDTEQALAFSVALPQRATEDLRAVAAAIIRKTPEVADPEVMEWGGDDWHGSINPEEVARDANVPLERVLTVLPYLGGYTSLSKTINDEGDTLLQVSLDEGGIDMGVEEDTDTLNRVEVERLLATLPDDEAYVLKAVYLMGHSYAEVGAVLGISKPAVQKKLNKAVNKLRIAEAKKGGE
jgi:RNA polymerase sigma factor (sigma-70 family)